MIPANIIHRVIRIKCGDSVGTGFLIDVDGRQYLVTAKHVVSSFGPKGKLEFFGNDAWESVATTLVAHGAGDIDVSVLAPSIELCPSNLPIQASSDGLNYGQDVYFLGFPYGVLSNVTFLEGGRPLPLVKRGILSAFAGNTYLLDGHNNPGFSGGPVVFSPSRTSPTSIAAIISGYRFAPEPVYLQSEATPLSYRQNTGIIISYKIELALAMIRDNPIGISIS